MTRRVLVTGVSSGIGLAQASLFLEKGYQVYGVDKARKPNLTGDFESSIMKLATSPCSKIFVSLSLSKPVISFDNRLEAVRLSCQG